TLTPNTPAGFTKVFDSRGGSPDGTDEVATGPNGVELLRFTDAFVMNTTTLNLSGFGPTGGASIIGTNANNNNVGDTLTISSGGPFPTTIDLAGGGADTLILGATGGYVLSVSNTEQITGTGGSDALTLNNQQFNTTTIDLGGGND